MAVVIASVHHHADHRHQAEQAVDAANTALFGVVVAIALILSGIGFIVLALGGALRRARESGREEVPRAERAAGAT